MAEFNRVCDRLIPWPDSVAGLHQPKPRITLAALSSGNLSLRVDMATHAGLPWDCGLSAELFNRCKPDPEVCHGAARFLGLPPAHVMVVAAHPSDLRAAAACGLRTAYVPRPLESGRGGPMEPSIEGEFDVVAAE